MSKGIPEVSRRTFLSATALATLAAASPAAASALAGQAQLALASRVQDVPTDWSGSRLVLAGSYSARMTQMRGALARHGMARVTPFLDDADAVLFDVARHDLGRTGR